jgi:hypothetical protein
MERASSSPNLSQPASQLASRQERVVRMRHPSRSKNAQIARCLTLLTLAISTSTPAGLIQGEVLGVPAGKALELVRNDQVVARVVVLPGQRFSVFLEPGRYTVRCPTSTTTIFALKGPVVQNIICPDFPSEGQR